MIPRIVTRTRLALKRSLGTIIALAGAVVVVGVLAAHAGKMPALQMGAEAQSTDCADIVMDSLDGPNEPATRAAYDCLSPRMQSQVGTVESMVRANANFTVSTHARIAESPPHSDGSIYVYYDSNMGSQHEFYVVELDSTGHVVSIG